MYPKFCKECVWSEPEERSNWNLRCHNPLVNGSDSWSLSSTKVSGTSCQNEREKTWFAVCGIKGKQFEAK